MSENLDLVCSIYARWAQGDLDPSEWADPKIEYVVGDGPHPGEHKGLAEVVRTQREIMSAWAEWAVDVESCRELDAERVLVLSQVTGRGDASGLRLKQDRAAQFHLRDGKVTCHLVWWDRERALADLGLAE